jgi:hypothetical protein
MKKPMAMNIKIKPITIPAIPGPPNPPLLYIAKPPIAKLAKPITAKIPPIKNRFPHVDILFSP